MISFLAEHNHLTVVRYALYGSTSGERIVEQDKHFSLVSPSIGLIWWRMFILSERATKSRLSLVFFLRSTLTHSTSLNFLTSIDLVVFICPTVTVNMMGKIFQLR